MIKRLVFIVSSCPCFSGLGKIEEKMIQQFNIKKKSIRSKVNGCSFFYVTPKTVLVDAQVPGGE
jgi:hypothetical protein